MTHTEELRTESQTLWLLAELSAETPARERLVSLRQALETARETDPEDPMAVLWLAGLEEALDSDAGWLEVRKDYVRLFSGVYKEGGPTPPMQSAVMPDGGDMVQLMAHLADLFARSGFVRPEGLSHAHDHVSTLLFCLAAQRFGQAQALDEGDTEAAERFQRLYHYTLRNHLLPWVPAWLEQAQRHARSTFYKAWMAGLNDAVHQLRATLETEDA
ncbi:molecular chaperone TorD family protein [Hahella sp. SMD15-11]|uniref:Molecular chaperone TorD family protein n=1 Tax=Thermohahella caldifontis TaxID=3142973 RepID=A0AB39UVW9_9GAMM